jgi:hypothetical protein
MYLLTSHIPSVHGKHLKLGLIPGFAYDKRANIQMYRLCLTIYIYIYIYSKLITIIHTYNNTIVVVRHNNYILV